MAPPFIVPPSVPLIDPLVSWPSRLNNEPPGTEGRLVIPATIKWSDYLPVSAIGFDCQQAQGPQPISQLVAIWIDATQSDADVFVLCNDMKTQVVQPARTQGLQPLSTQALNFVVSSPAAAAADIVNIQVFNYRPRYIEILPAALVSAAAPAGINLTGANTLQLIPNTTNGILTGLSLQVFNVVGGAAPGSYQFAVLDGEAPAVGIANAGYAHAAAGGPDNAIILAQPNLQVRFKLGIQVTTAITGTAFASGILLGNATFR